MDERIKVPAEVLEGLEAVRSSGVVNLFDRPAVQYYADQFGYPAAVVWIEENQAAFARGIFNGFVASEGEGGV